MTDTLRSVIRGGFASVVALGLCVCLGACTGPIVRKDGGAAEAPPLEEVAADAPAAESAGAGEAQGADAGGATTETATEAAAEAAPERLDLLVLVNADHALPEGWEQNLDLVEVVNPKGDAVRLDRLAYDKFLELQRDLADMGVTIELNSGYRSIEEQQAIWDEFMADYGEEYVLEFVAVPGHSEHHTGIALDAYLVLDGVPQLTNEEIFAAQDTWDIIHSRLADHGFILRYLNGADEITGYSYEPWHFRYVGEDAAHEIAARGCTLEEYLGAV